MNCGQCVYSSDSSSMASLGPVTQLLFGLIFSIKHKFSPVGWRNLNMTLLDPCMAGCPLLSRTVDGFSPLTVCIVPLVQPDSLCTTAKTHGTVPNLFWWVMKSCGCGVSLVVTRNCVCGGC